MLPVGLIVLMLTKKLEVGFYADPPKNKLAVSPNRLVAVQWLMGDRAKCRFSNSYPE
jgi:hypothetical protein